MLTWGWNEHEIRDAIRHVSDKAYQGNVILQYEGIRSRGKALRWRLDVRSSHGPGARRRASDDARMRVACWHVYRDVMTRLFELNPDGRIKTAQADYRGRGEFEDKFPDTGHANIGSIMRPVEYRDACDCER